MVVTSELRDVSRMALRDVNYEIGAFVTLVDSGRFDSWWEERPQLLIGQISGADIVALSRSDLTAPEQQARIRTIVGAYANGIVAISSRHPPGVEDILRRIG